MTWVKIDDHTNEHPKILTVAQDAMKAAAACWLWTCGLMYCNRQKKRIGFIPEAQVPGLYAKFTPAQSAALAKELVRAGLWEVVPGGYQVHDYHDFQPRGGGGGGPVDPELSAKRSAAGAAGGHRSGETRRKQSFASDEATGEATDESKDEARSEAIPPRARAGADARRAGSGSVDLVTREQEQEEPTGIRARGRAERPEAAYDLGLRVFSELWQAKYRRPYRFAARTGPGSDDFMLRELGEWGRERGDEDAERWVRHLVSSYLKDTGERGRLNDEAHPLAWLVKYRLNKYPDPPAPKPRRVAEPAPVEAPMPSDTYIARARALIGATAAALAANPTEAKEASGKPAA